MMIVTVLTERISNLRTEKKELADVRSVRTAKADITSVALVEMCRRNLSY
jgi:hypothetical protein